MGTWSTELLGNDYAWDLIDFIADGSFDFAEVEQGMEGDYVDFDTGAAVLVLLEVALAARGLRDMPEPLIGLDVGALVTDERARWLIGRATRVLDVGSEQYELWRQSGTDVLEEWLAIAGTAVSDLQRAVGLAEENR